MSKNPRMENWTVAVEGGKLRLQGKVYNHPNPRHHDGKAINTSPIDTADGNHVLCSNRQYELGTADASFAERCSESGITFDPKRPADAINALVEKLCPGRPLLN